MFHWNVPGKWFIVFIYVQIYGVNFEIGDHRFESCFIYDPIQKIKIFDQFFFDRARCLLTVFFKQNSLFW